LLEVHLRVVFVIRKPKAAEYAVVHAEAEHGLGVQQNSGVHPAPHGEVVRLRHADALVVQDAEIV
jgi:hypothetical protein